MPIDTRLGRPTGIASGSAHLQMQSLRPGISRVPGQGQGEGAGSQLLFLLSTTAGSGDRLGLIVHHDDAEREYAYDGESSNNRFAGASTRRRSVARSLSA